LFIIVFVIILCVIILCWCGYLGAATRPGYMPGQMMYGKPAGTPYGGNPYWSGGAAGGVGAADVPYATAYTPYANAPSGTQLTQQYTSASQLPSTTTGSTTDLINQNPVPSASAPAAASSSATSAPIEPPPPDYSPQREYVEVTKSTSANGTPATLADTAQVSNYGTSSTLTGYPTASQPMKI